MHRGFVKIRLNGLILPGRHMKTFVVKRVHLSIETMRYRQACELFRIAAFLTLFEVKDRDSNFGQ